MVTPGPNNFRFFCFQGQSELKESFNERLAKKIDSLKRYFEPSFERQAHFEGQVAPGPQLLAQSP